MGIYTKEEIEYNDFNEYPMEDLQTQVQKDIAENANSQEFEPEEVTKSAAEPSFLKE